MSISSDGGTLIFLHIFKTAGTSLRMMMVKLYPEASTYQYYKSQNPTPLEELPAPQRAKIRLMSSHEPLGTHDAYLTPPIHYITMLRDPIQRVISQFNYRKGMEGEINHIPSSLIDFSSSLIEGHQDNLHVRFISGLGFEGPVTESTLKQAKENLAAPFMTFGIVERYKESLLLFKRKFHWPRVSLRKRNVTPREAIVPVDQAARKAIAEHNPFDIELYEYALDLFSQRASEAGITMAEVAGLKLADWVGSLKGFRLRARHALRRSLRKR